MNKTIIALTVLGALTLSGCSDYTSNKTEASTSQSQSQKTELGSFGIDLSARNVKVKPGDDFFMYANGTWYDNFVMPADKTSYGAFAVLNERSKEQVKTIIEELPNKSNLSTEEQLIANFYHSFMDEISVNAKGISPIQPMLNEIKALSKASELASLFGSSWLSNSMSPINSGLSINRKDPNAYQMSVSAGGLGLPDRAYYLEDNERFASILSEYEKHIATMLTFAGEKDTAKKAQQIIALETEIATAQWPREKRRDRDLTLNQIKREDLTDMYSNFDWDTYFDATGYTVKDINISHPQPIKDIIKILNKTELNVWKDYLTFHLISGNASLLSEEVVKADFDFYNAILNGQQEQRPRWKRAVSMMDGTQSLGFAIGKVYINRHFPESSKKQMTDLVENLRKALGERIANLDWMSEETKKNAQEKLASFKPKIAYPDKWLSFDGLSLSSDDLFGNVLAMRKFFHNISIDEEFDKTDRDEWFMAPQRVNAYYNPPFNEIVFPAAILQPPFFDPNADAAVNYGAIGAVIGHEIGHGFDDQGSKSDAMGVQRNWWTDKDRDAFEAKTMTLVKQYDKYEALPGQFVNGANSLGENIGDVGGLAMAYHAYKLSLQGKEAPIIEGLTGDQRFFLAWAQVWRVKFTEEVLINRLRGGTHAPGQFRAQAPRNHDAWYEAFNVKPGDALYLPPEERVHIW